MLELAAMNRYVEKVNKITEKRAQREEQLDYVKEKLHEKFIRD